MILKDLFKKFKKEDKKWANRLLELYPDQKKNLPGYFIAVVELEELKLKKTSWQIQIKLVEDEDGDYHDVGGWYDSQEWGLDLTDWDEWLGMSFTQDTLDNYSELDILCHCLWEMTWHGYSQREVKEMTEMLGGRIEDLKEQCLENEN